MAPTFLNGLPARSLDELHAVGEMVGFLGIPWDTGSIYGPGAAQAPEAIRKASQKFDGYHVELELRLETLPIVDIGDILCNDLESTSTDRSIQILRDRVQNACSSPSIPKLLLIAGGDHLITATAFFPPNSEKSSLLWLDSHLDLMDAYPEGKNWTNSTVLRRTIELTGLPPENVWVIGTHGYDHGAEEFEYVHKQGIHYYPLHKFRHNPHHCINEIITDISEKEFVYLSTDVDVLDPAFAPGTLARTPGGLTPFELFGLIRAIAPYLDVMDLVEVYPNHDPVGITAEIAAATFLEACAYRFRRP
jgi:agmatinase